ncbi:MULTISPECIES: alkaline phosphatase family protein [Micrococcaceae]|uniref:alkaline phosphatase family protein n=1 Tax=Micrococcaceae TaxID=1268 RepID=UPI00138218CD|nr:alkaline phosphatase family protein [Pseudarthrobacter sp. C1]MEA3552134.1 alkaline phosphatase family protein [Pseudarthrobacter sp. C1]MUU71407.1 twin-arginine translocation signal domain-containing protein [Pseudarthrobacter sp. GA104]HET7781255.1 alkaline phosphatase family protein [Arthrobacter sp.]
MNPDRRQFLRLAGAGSAAVVLSAAPGTSWAGPATNPGTARTRTYVLVVDGCRPDEITPELTPRLAALRTQGTNFPAARSLPVMETIPNHVMMMTGVRPDRSGVPANSVYDPAEGAARDMDRETDLRFPTLLERLRDSGFTTASVLSKKYLYGIFGTRASYRWEPYPLLPVTGHAPDAATMDALLAIVSGPDPDFTFTNLGDVDRMGHSDLTGTTLQAARTAALADTDLQVGRLVDHLVDTGKWESSVLVVLADHSMDWSLPTNVVSVDLILQARPDLRSSITVAQNGGADLLYWTGPSEQKAAGLQAVRSLVESHPGVLSVQAPAELRLGAEAGDLVAFCRAGWRFSDPYIVSNPIPGNHGHPATEPIPFFISGGSPRVLRGRTSSDPARTVDVAPTVGALYGLKAPSGGYDGVARTTAFSG